MCSSSLVSQAHGWHRFSLVGTSVIMGVLTFTVESAFPETSVFLLSSIPLVKDW